MARALRWKPPLTARIGRIGSHPNENGRAGNFFKNNSKPFEQKKRFAFRNQVKE